MKFLIYFSGLLLSMHIMASSESGNAANQAQNVAREKKEQNAIPTAPGQIKFVKNPSKVGLVATHTGQEF